MKRIERRRYQEEALEWALRHEGAVICMPTGTGKTVIAGLWIKNILDRGGRKVLVLEPTRILVEQTSRVFREMGIPAKPLHGSLSRGLREEARKARVVVATPEIIVSEGLEEEPDALVVDECHHTTGQDPYRQVVEQVRPRRRLGLSAFIPPSRRGLIERSIGVIRCWSWEDEEIRRYMPPLVAEVYEAPLNHEEMGLYRTLEKMWMMSSGKERMMLGNSIRWYVRDGAEALRETYRGSISIHELLEGLEEKLFSPAVRPAHKLEHLLRVLDDHEGFRKAYIFVDRVVIARLIRDRLGDDATLLIGRRHGSIAARLEEVRSREKRIVVSTSVGEEGIDLPEADLLVVWSQVASPLRFIQRMGRLLRPGQGGQKYLVFIATPDTVDMDSLVDGLATIERLGVATPVSREVLEELIMMSSRRRILEALEERPMTLEELASATGMDQQRARQAVRSLLEAGLAVYIYTDRGRIYAARHGIEKLYDEYRLYLTPNRELEAYITFDGASQGITGRYDRGWSRLRRALSRHGVLRNIHGYVKIIKAGLMHLARYRYSYPVSEAEVLDMIIDNIYSADKWFRR